MSKFSNELIRLRKARELSQIELANELDVSQNCIGNYEQGIREPNIEMLKLIADYFDVNMASFFDDVEPQKNIIKNTKTSISQRLRQIMSDRNLKQIDIIHLCEPYCEQLGIRITQPDLSQYINGKNEPGQKKLWILASALNVSEGWLMGLDVPINPYIKYNESATEECNENAIAVGKRIKTKRMLLGLTQQQLADRAGFESRTSINKIELGSRSLSASKIKVIADALHTTPEYIMGWNERPKLTMGEYIRHLRKQNGLSQEQLGRMCGVKKAAVNKWETGSVENIKRSTIKRLSEIFDVPPEDLMCWNGSNAFSVLAERYHLSNNAVSFIKSFIELSEDDQNTFLRFIEITKSLQN